MLALTVPSWARAWGRRLRARPSGRREKAGHGGSGLGPDSRFLPSFLPGVRSAPPPPHKGPDAEPRVCREAGHSRSLRPQGWWGPQHTPRLVLWGPRPVLPQKPLQLCSLPPGPLGPRGSTLETRQPQPQPQTVSMGKGWWEGSLSSR